MDRLEVFDLASKLSIRVFNEDQLEVFESGQDCLCGWPVDFSAGVSGYDIG